MALFVLISGTLIEKHKAVLATWQQVAVRTAGSAQRVFHAELHTVMWHQQLLAQQFKFSCTAALRIARETTAAVRMDAVVNTDANFCRHKATICLADNHVQRSGCCTP
jgi:hypothetical protein